MPQHIKAAAPQLECGRLSLGHFAKVSPRGLLLGQFLDAAAVFVLVHLVVAGADVHDEVVGVANWVDYGVGVGNHGVVEGDFSDGVHAFDAVGAGLVFVGVDLREQVHEVFDTHVALEGDLGGATFGFELVVAVGLFVAVDFGFDDAFELLHVIDVVHYYHSRLGAELWLVKVVVRLLLLA